MAAGKKRSDRIIASTSWSKPMKALDAECSVTHWTLHDLRRTFSSGMAALKVPQVVFENLLNHVSGDPSRRSHSYNRHQSMEEARAALLQWEERVDNLISPKGLSNPGVS